MQPLRNLAIVIGASLLLGVAAAATAQTKPARIEAGTEPIRSILWVGNSFFYYNNSMHGHVQRAGPCRRSRRQVPRDLGDDQRLRPRLARRRELPAARRHRQVLVRADNKIVFNSAGRQFDAVIMMDCSQCPIHPQLEGAFPESVKKDAAIVKKYGARPILFMSWAYKDHPEMTAQLAEQYTLAGNANDALVIPAGLAFAKAVSKRPELELYQSDKRHPTLAGTYLAACTAYASVLKQSPVGNKYTAGLDPELAAFLQGVAADTAREYFGVDYR